MTNWRIDDKVTWFKQSSAIFGIAMLIVACGLDRTTHEKSLARPSDYRHLAWRMMEEVAGLKSQFPYLAELDLASNLTETFHPIQLELVYEYGRIQVANARWMPDDNAPKTIQHYTRDGLFFRLSLTLESQEYEQSVAANRIGQLLIVLDTNGPKSYQIRSAIGKIVNKHRSQFAENYRL